MAEFPFEGKAVSVLRAFECFICNPILMTFYPYPIFLTAIYPYKCYNCESHRKLRKQGSTPGAAGRCCSTVRPLNASHLYFAFVFLKLLLFNCNVRRPQMYKNWNKSKIQLSSSFPSANSGNIAVS